MNYIGSVFPWVCNYEPDGYIFCDGRLLNIEEPYEILFSVIETRFGGDGITNFAVPDLRGRVPVSLRGIGDFGPFELGEKGGSANYQLTVKNLPPHTHQLNAYNNAGTSSDPMEKLLADTGTDRLYSNLEPFSATMNKNVIGSTGKSAPISLMQPYMAVNFIICYDGLTPPR